MKNMNLNPRRRARPFSPRLRLRRMWERHLSITDRLAVVRTELANERTLLAYFRTFIGLFAAGVGLIRFTEDALFVQIGIVMTVASPGILIVGFLRFLRERRILLSAAQFDPTLDDLSEAAEVTDAPHAPNATDAADTPNAPNAPDAPNAANEPHTQAAPDAPKRKNPKP